MIYSQEYETMQRSDLEQLQVERLQATLNRVYRNVSFYRNLYDEKGVEISNIKSLANLGDLPFTTKEDLRNSYPYEAFAVPLKSLIIEATAQLSAVAGAVTVTAASHTPASAVCV